MNTLSNELYHFTGPVVFGLSKQDGQKTVAVFRKGALLNDKNFPKFDWPDSIGKEDNIRHYWVAPHEAELMTQGEIKKEMNISNLKSDQLGWKIYYDTPIGDVLYITCGTYRRNWLASVQQGFFDKSRGINPDNIKKAA